MSRHPRLSTAPSLLMEKKDNFPKQVFFLTSKILEGLALGEIEQRGGEVIPFCRVTAGSLILTVASLGTFMPWSRPPPRDGCGVRGTPAWFPQRALQAHARRVPDALLSVIPGFLMVLRRLNFSVETKMAIFRASQLLIRAPIADDGSKMTREKLGVEGSLLLLTVSSKGLSKAGFGTILPCNC